MKRTAIGCLVLSAVMVLAPQMAHAAGFATFSGLGNGNVAVAFSGCADVTCAGGHSCFCAEGTFPFKATGGIGAGSAHVELLMDNNTQSLNATGVCENTGGRVFFVGSKPANTLTFGLAGTFCQTNSATAAINHGGFTILSGAGNFAHAAGTGIFSFGGPALDSFGTSQMQLQFTGNFNKTGASAATVANPQVAPGSLPSDR